MTDMSDRLNNLLNPPFDRLRVNGGCVFVAPELKQQIPFVLSLNSASPSKRGYANGFKASCTGHESP